MKKTVVVIAAVLHDQRDGLTCISPLTGEVAAGLLVVARTTTKNSPQWAISTKRLTQNPTQTWLFNTIW